MTPPRVVRSEEAGFVAILLVILMLPLLLVTGTFLHTMTGRNSRLRTEMSEEQALFAAEAGLDVALHRARLGTLSDGMTLSEVLPCKSSFDAAIEYFGNDGIDNDADGTVDEPEEDVYQVTSTGRSVRSVRRIVGYVGFSATLPALGAAATILNRSATIEMGGSARINGYNHELDGSLAGSGNLPGMGITPPGGVADLLGELSLSERLKILGTGFPPSLTSSPGLVLDNMVNSARHAAHVVIQGASVQNRTFGDLASGTAHVVYRNGNVRMSGNVVGTGLLVVTGDLVITGNFRWNGVVVVLGKMDNGAGNAQINGAVITGPASPLFRMRGTSDVKLSRAAVDLVLRVTGRYVLYDGWHEIGTH